MYPDDGAEEPPRSSSTIESDEAKDLDEAKSTQSGRCYQLTTALETEYNDTGQHHRQIHTHTHTHEKQNDKKIEK